MGEGLAHQRVWEHPSYLSQLPVLTQIPRALLSLCVKAQLAPSAPVYNELMLEKPELAVSSPDSPGRPDKEA